ncbi:DUF4301 family protein [Belliella kenyensis]|uniref:DUF4301 family protein n=1 Tax=Belliella kenyensis TaxID=1472724 RepID=A0ABV8EJM1_9BACT|nr:DUF4301 family protein [Belliella kenyensis]MCH7400378.1 DUF4301 family protein [Belliella kenyensis]MDN3604604.1 DUF4301 family protein [Belliella kenyensis]
MNQEIEKQILAQGMSLDQAKAQITHFEEGFPFLPIVAPATTDNGIKQLSESKLNEIQKSYSKKIKNLKVLKFVPASGAASRMFKDLFSFLEGDGDLTKSPFTEKFIINIRKFAFYDDLDIALKAKGSSIKEAIQNKQYKEIVATLLEDKGLSYGSLPKGLLKFHKYEDENRTPIFEHFIEGLQYAKGHGNTVRIHFTVSPEHEEKFQAEVNQIKQKLEDKEQTKFEISYSQQKKSTDTIAVNKDNSPFVEEHGEVLFRPAGHGALLENLNEVDADLIFIKNIDNVVPDRIKDTTQRFKIGLGGMLLNVQDQVFKALESLENDFEEDTINTAISLLQKEFGINLSEDFDKMSNMEKGKHLFQKLNKPIRVCGMVKNTGEPGGGPFWVKEEDGSQSLQIAETAQINMQDPKLRILVQQSTHFNPVDLVCGTKDYKGKKFDLLMFRDMKTGFITEKSKSGRELKALELPGLWNGAMAGWNTIFVEVPLITFNPVKTVNDLLRDEHQ